MTGFMPLASMARTMSICCRRLPTSTPFSCNCFSKAVIIENSPPSPVRMPISETWPPIRAAIMD